MIYQYYRYHGMNKILVSDKNDDYINEINKYRSINYFKFGIDIVKYII
jgi:hypothetical protein